MPTFKKIDIILNVLFPIIIGTFIYNISGLIKLPLYVRDQFPDGLWAYSFISCILIIWNRAIKILWILIAFASFTFFEIFQALGIINGIGDLLDILVYFTFSIVALLSNKYFLKFLKYRS
jgi:hypothetical protein